MTSKQINEQSRIMTMIKMIVGGDAMEKVGEEKLSRVLKER